MQGATFVLFGAAEVYVLVLSEVDLSVGFVGGVAAFIIAELIAGPVSFPWWVGVLAGCGAGAAIGVLQGTLVSRLHLPSFVVTLGALLFWEGVMIELANADPAATGGVMRIDSSSPVFKLVNSNMSVALSWIVLAAVIALFAFASIRRVNRGRAQGLSEPPLSVILFRIALAALGGFLVVLVCKQQPRGAHSAQGRAVGGALRRAGDIRLVVADGEDQARPLFLRDRRQP